MPQNSELTEAINPNVVLSVDYIYAYRVVKALYQDWKDTDAYELGLIDEKGEKLKSPESTAEKAAYSPFMRMVFRIKKLIEKVPGGSSKLGSLAAAYMLLKEEEIMKISDFLNEELTHDKVVSKNYSWGTMKTVHHGKDFSIPLHPEHHQAISKLKDGESHSFKDETGSKWKAERHGDDVHFSGASHDNSGYKSKVKHSDLHEATKEEEEEFHEKLDKLVHKVFGKRKKEKECDEDAPVNTTSGATSPSTGGIDKPLGKIVLRRFSDKKRDKEAAV